ncbi:hypothetical protein L1049_018932 [Liquidambar formosana]|uniref:Uncharacterized protein n=1 Tax=Liquidambar formosana TaxID=63359 RepID=A0AAP0WMZ9_LIQFO
MEAELTAKIILAVVSGGLLVVFVGLYELLVLKPNRLRSKLQRQGIRGPSPSFLLGNIPEMKRIQLQVQSTAGNSTKRSPPPPPRLALVLLMIGFLPCFHILSNGDINMGTGLALLFPEEISHIHSVVNFYQIA